ncbi:MAG: hypothetical protein ACRDAM_20800 [Casimicrobium sp.]
MPLRAGFEAAITKQIAPKLERGATLAGLMIIDRLSQPGSGEKYAGLPNRSSAPGEYPARQSGELVNSIDARALTPLRFGIGSFNAPDHAYWLEFDPPGAPGFERETESGVRRWLSRTMEDPTVQEAIKREVLK